MQRINHHLKCYYLITTLFLSCLANNAWATESSINIDLTKPIAYINKEFEIGVKTNITNLYGYDLDLLFDPEVLEPLSVSEGNFLSSDGATTYWLTPKFSQDRITGIACLRMGTKTNISGSGLLAKVRFRAKTVGTSTLLLQNVALSDIGSQRIKAVITNSQIRVMSSPEINITHDAKTALNAGKVIHVTLSGDGGGTATFDIGNLRQNLPMIETSAGVYKGSYTVLPGDNMINATLTGHLKITDIAPGIGFASSTVTIDTVAPISTITVSGPQFIATTGSRYVSSNTSFILMADDNHGINRIEYQMPPYSMRAYTGSFSLASTKPTTIYYRAMDLAGNVERSQSIIVVPDNQAPVTVDNIPTDWQRGTVSIILTPSDGNGCGVNWIYCFYPSEGTDTTLYQLNGSPNVSVLINKEGTHNLRYFSEDYLGNKEEVKNGSQVIKIDRTCPQLSISQPNSGAIVTRSDLSLQGTVSDNLVEIGSVTLNSSQPIGVKDHLFIATLTLASGFNYVTIAASDMAANTSTSSLSLELVTAKANIMANQAGVLESPNARVELSEHTFSQDITLAINETPKTQTYTLADQALARGLPFLEITPELKGSVYQISAFGLDDCTRSFQPSKPGTITLIYPQTLTSTAVSNLRVLHLNPVAGEWELSGEAVIDTLHHCLRLPSANFGLYRLAERFCRLEVVEDLMHLGIVVPGQSSIIGSYQLKNISFSDVALTHLRYNISELKDNSSQKTINASNIYLTMAQTIASAQQIKGVVRVNIPADQAAGIYTGLLSIYNDSNNNNQFDPNTEDRDTLKLIVIVNLQTAPTKLSFYPTRKECQLNEEDTVSIRAENVTNLTGFDFSVRFNPAIIEVLEVVKDDFLSLNGGSYNWTNPVIDNQQGIISGISCNQLKYIRGSGNLVKIRFKPKRPGRSNLTLEQSFLSLVPDNKSLIRVTDDYIKVNPWDINLDAKVDIYDLVVVGAHFGSKLSDEEYLPEGDVTDDGLIDVYDLVLVGSHFRRQYNYVFLSPPLEQPVDSEEAASLSILPTDYSVKPGDEVTILVHIDSPIELYGLQFELLFDPNVLEVVNITQGNFLSSDGAECYWLSPRVTSGKISSLAGTRLEIERGIKGSGNLAEIRFKAIREGISCLSLDNIKLSSKEIKQSISAAQSDSLIKVKAQLSDKRVVAWPNPFYASLHNKLYFDVPDGVPIKIYNITGELVEELREREWDVKRSNLASGIYIYVINGQTGKLGIIK